METGSSSGVSGESAAEETLRIPGENLDHLKAIEYFVLAAIRKEVKLNVWIAFGAGHHPMTPLIMASMFKQWHALRCVQGGEALKLSNEYVQTLVQMGADVNKRRQRDQSTPLMAAAKYGDAETLRILLAAGADLTAKDVMGCNPFFQTMEVGNPSKVKCLIDAGVDFLSTCPSFAKLGERLSGGICRHQCSRACLVEGSEYNTLAYVADSRTALCE
uniref:Uncharacterized protein n=1 Tax=Chromera velia CCMP2878 TaxID=1169474 RepID=A0A0G4G5T5_9ALVE|eukprot:Cvel_20271.t1-p1 / transcript=Cvel_20271.t1 / gene=Cvel_20271 / organism=Chromera_velia_CCMP2878 / gene_product=hypothetical protein / transcript_product=hypothetical protein / location=Cvel_scaffold1808:36759-37406(-) / protein_length=216 / sequence_SO=supercontig / SO=protein_coding / is_pseudo=false